MLAIWVVAGGWFMPSLNYAPFVPAVVNVFADVDVTFLLNFGAVGVFLLLFLTGQVYSKETVRDLRDTITRERLEAAQERQALLGQVDAARGEVTTASRTLIGEAIPAMTRMVDASQRLLDYLTRHG